MTAITITSTGYRLMAARLLPPPASSTPSSLQSGVLRRGGRTQEQVVGSQEVGEVHERGAPLHLQEQEEESHSLRVLLEHCTFSSARVGRQEQEQEVASNTWEEGGGRRGRIRGDRWGEGNWCVEG